MATDAEAQVGVHRGPPSVDVAAGRGDADGAVDQGASEGAGRVRPRG